ncbi:Uridylate kinase [ANME-1 cluster archaeon GoMg3.2]|nr:Uridylate kinase [ANME-1 cluster archaeon GoMg3.2]
MKVVFSIGGIYFADAARIKALAGVLDELAESYTLYVVTGGGAIARDGINIARDLGANEAYCDYVGIAVTRLNAKLLITALKNANPEPFSDYKEAAAMQKDNKIAVMGGVSPGHTTDAVAAILAEYVDADRLIVVTSVDGVYDADPHVYPDAKKYDRLTAKELVALTMKKVLKAGLQIVIDPVAAKIIERSGIETIVIDGRNPRNITGAVHGDHHGTVIS